MKNQRYRIPALMLCTIVLLLLTACSDMTQIEDKDFVLAAGISFGQEKFQITYARPDLSALTGQPVGEKEKLVVTYSGIDLPTIEEDYARNSNKRLDLNHLKVIVLDYKILEEKEKMRELLQFIENNNEISRNTLVFYTKGPANEILELDTNTSGNIGENLEKMYENNPYNSDTQKITIGDMVNGLYQDGKVILIPELEIRDDRIWLSGAGIFMENVYVASVDENVLTYMNMMSGIGRGRNIVLDNGDVVKIKEIKTKDDFAMKAAIPYLFLHISGVGEMVQHNITKDSEFILNKHIKNNMISLYKTMMKEKKVDYLNLYRKISYKNRIMWEQYEDNQEQFIEEINMDIVVEFTLQ